MLQGIARAELAHVLHRLANLSFFGAFAQSKGLSFDQAREVVALMGEESAEDLLKKPFEPKALLDPVRPFGTRTRFSDGSWPVLYAALEEATAEEECLHHYAKEAMGGSKLAVYYSTLRCDFRGEVIDLRPQLPAWPELVANDYGFCQGLGKEAVGIALGSFLAPSARRVDGTTAPVFSSHTLSNPKIGVTVRMSWDASGALIERV